MDKTESKIQRQRVVDGGFFLATNCLLVVSMFGLVVLGFFKVVPWTVLYSICKGSIIILLAETLGGIVRQRYIGRGKGLISNFVGGLVIFLLAAVLATIAVLWGVSFDGSFDSSWWNAIQSTFFLLVGLAGIEWIHRIKEFMQKNQGRARVNRSKSRS